MADTFNKKEREKKKLRKRKEKLERKEDRKEHSKGGGLESMMAYVDENGVIRDTPPDPEGKTKIKAKDIEIGVPKKEEVEEPTEFTGTVQFFDEKKGYGFIKDDAGQSYFVHINNVSGEPKANSKVSFEREKQPRGWVALHVRVL